MNNKQIAFAGVWNKYLPAIRILIKKAAAAEQVITINQSDMERAVGIKKSGYRFSIDFVNGRPDLLYSNNEIAQALISVLTEDEVIREYLSGNNYTFSFNNKYQLQIKINLTQKEVMSPDAQENAAR
ncbi:hypothetical protein [Parafilimonas terrae]|uniref:Uncharacterized protein n=1 Tax=Parafilimonas terrae TaxID=1465490 RepID=A0A1I5VW49_9BACT|nr:hypothetical protein [Parafilimonas terrae]SFQ11705.1 hypothetical protein SAMN05444277_105223 [Parafilimonas terrae]